MSKHDESQVDPKLLQAYKAIVEHLTNDPLTTNSDKENYADTAIRAAKAFSEMVILPSDLKAAINEVTSVAFPMEPNVLPSVITQGPIDLVSFCPHHLLTVTYDCYISYLPQTNGAVLGLSKLARIAKLLAKRPVLQEQLANDIADTLYQGNKSKFGGIKTDGCAVMLIGRHSCMAQRGVHCDAPTTISVVRGAYFRDNTLEQRFFQTIALNKEHRHD